MERNSVYFTNTKYGELKTIDKEKAKVECCTSVKFTSPKSLLIITIFLFINLYLWFKLSWNLRLILLFKIIFVSFVFYFSCRRKVIPIKHTSKTTLNETF